MCFVIFHNGNNKPFLMLYHVSACFIYDLQEKVDNDAYANPNISAFFK